MTISVFPLAEGLTSPGLVNGTNDLVEDRRLIVCQIRGVSDAAAVRQHVVAGSLGVDCAAFNSDMVLSPACLLAAAMRVLLHESRDKLVTKTIHSELLLMMSGGRRINEAFRVFGIGDTSSNLLLASFASKEDEEKTKAGMLAAAKDVIGAQAMPITEEEMIANADVGAIRKHFNITDEELEQGGASVEDCVVTRIAVGELKL